jgi:hypothetical protein
LKGGVTFLDAKSFLIHSLRNEGDRPAMSFASSWSATLKRCDLNEMRMSTQESAQLPAEEDAKPTSTTILCSFDGCSAVIGELRPGDKLSPNFAGRCKKHVKRPASVKVACSSAPVEEPSEHLFLTKILENPLYFNLDLGEKKLLARRKTSAAKHLSYDGGIEAQKHGLVRNSTQRWTLLKEEMDEKDANRLSIYKEKKPRIHKKPAWLEGSTLQERRKYLAERAIQSLVGNPAAIFVRWEKVVELYYYRGWIPEEIADKIGSTKSAVRSIIRQLNR